MSFFNELKRRNVFRVGIAYAVGAWLLLQLTEVLVGLLNLPETIGPIVVAMVVIGFPVVLFAAWAYELTPQGLRRESEVQAETSFTRSTGRGLNAVIIVLMALSITYLLYDKFVLRDTPPADEATVAETARQREADAPGTVTAEDEPPAPDISRRSIAVLPFTNRSPVAEDEFFIDGIHDDLLTNLARIGELKVISRTSVARFRDTDTPIPDIARQLGVATVMEGAVQRAGDMVRINVQLIDAATDEHLWAQIYDRPLTTDNLFSIQTEIAEAIAAALEAKLTPEEEQRIQKRYTDNLAAYSAYLRGMRAFERREIESMRSALGDFQRAVELDPDFALGWAGIAQVAEVLPSWGGISREEGEAIAIPAAERAMELAPDLGEANLALAITLEGEAVRAQYEKTIQMLPNHAMAHQWYANALQGAPGPDWNKALALLRKATDLDPLSPNHRSQVARQLIFMNRFEEAQKHLRIVLESDPDYAPANGFMSWAEAGQGNLDQSVLWSQRYLEQDSSARFPRFNMALNLANLQDRGRLEQLREAWSEAMPEDDGIRVVDLMLALLDARYDALLENLGDRALGPNGNIAFEQAWANTYARNYPAAFQAWQAAAPGLFDPEERAAAIRELPELVCVIADVARRVGEEDLASELVELNISYATTELPQFIDHAADEANLAHCYAAQGDFAAAVEQLETNLRHRHFEFWWEPRRLELFDPVRGEPRFEQVMQAFEDEMARQRASLDRLEADASAEAGP